MAERWKRWRAPEARRARKRRRRREWEEAIAETAARRQGPTPTEIEMRTARSSKR